MNWAATEFENIDLGDPRRNRRAIRLVERLSANPTASIPQACGDGSVALVESARKKLRCQLDDQTARL